MLSHQMMVKPWGSFSLSVPLTISNSAPLFNSPLSPGLTEVMTRPLGRHLPSEVPEGWEWQGEEKQGPFPLPFYCHPAPPRNWDWLWSSAKLPEAPENAAGSTVSKHSDNIFAQEVERCQSSLISVGLAHVTEREVEAWRDSRTLGS